MTSSNTRRSFGPFGRRRPPSWISNADDPFKPDPVEDTRPMIRRLSTLGNAVAVTSNKLRKSRPTSGEVSAPPLSASARDEIFLEGPTDMRQQLSTLAATPCPSSNGNKLRKTHSQQQRPFPVQVSQHESFVGLDAETVPIPQTPFDPFGEDHDPLSAVPKTHQGTDAGDEADAQPDCEPAMTHPRKRPVSMLSRVVPLKGKFMDITSMTRFGTRNARTSGSTRHSISAQSDESRYSTSSNSPSETSDVAQPAARHDSDEHEQRRSSLSSENSEDDYGHHGFRDSVAGKIRDLLRSRRNRAASAARKN